MASPDKVLNIGVIGTGIFATGTHLPNLQKIPQQFKVVACSNRTKSKAETFATKANISSDKIYESYDDLINDKDVDVIDALLPVENNAMIVEKAIKAGKAIAIEKPIANNLENAKKLVQLAQNTSVPVLVLENWLYHTATEVIKPKLKEIGTIIGFNFKSTGPFYAENKYLKTSWRAKPNHIGGYLSDGGVHQLAYLVELLGEAETISAHTTQVREQSGTDDVWFSTLKMKSGAIGTFTYGSAFGAVDKSRQFVIYGDKGSVVFDFSPANPKPFVKCSYGVTGENIKTETIEIEEKDSTNGIVSEFKNFHEATVSNDKSLLKCKPTIAFHHLAIVDAALKSSANGGSSVKVESI
ncbi:hypothetical protein DASC09_023010 [Saccharomycopsis crataegensis]|uniref:NAD(P)-binding protein n=1 Tax=Saccharomycopsis crataegensis TaxID=43959 RepID=A0AAV5QJW5_9ASCO|nr:hypothetical protein DASC09_023010 [Saccharomycopsis crataegensis]